METLSLPLKEAKLISIFDQSIPENSKSTTVGLRHMTKVTLLNFFLSPSVTRTFADSLDFMIFYKENTVSSYVHDHVILTVWLPSSGCMRLPYWSLEDTVMAKG